MINNIIGINESLKEILKLSTTLTPNSKNERFNYLIKETPVLLGMFSDRYSETETIFKGLELDREVKNSGGNYTYYLTHEGVKIEIENNMSLFELAKAFNKDLQFVKHLN